MGTYHAAALPHKPKGKIMEEQSSESRNVVLAGFMEERKQRANSAYTFALRDGKLVWTYPGIGEVEFDPSKASATNRARAMMFGWKQRLQDAAALEAGPDGKVSPRAKYDEMKRMAEHYEQGGEEWNLRAAAPTGPASYVTQALIALGTYAGKDVSTAEKANAFVKAVADEPKLGLKGQVGKARTWLESHSKQIREKIEELRAGETSDFDADAELENLVGKP